MIKQQALIIRVIKEIETELINLYRLESEYQSIPKTNRKPYILRARSSIFHDFYCGVERIFVKIANELNGGVPKSDTWHKELLKNMTLELDKIRPPVITEKLFNRLSIFLKFRHLFRNIYGFEIEDKKLIELDKIYISTHKLVQKELKKFIKWMNTFYIVN